MAEKLVRDLIPYIILHNDGKLPKMRIVAADPVEGLRFIVAKLDEEVAELKAVLAQENFTTDSGAMNDAINEAADVFEVLCRIVERKDMLDAAEDKVKARGAFTAMVVVDFPPKAEGIVAHPVSCSDHLGCHSDCPSRK